MSPSVPGFDSDIFLLFGSTFTYAKRTVREYSRLALCPRIWGYVPRNADGTERYALSPQWLRSDALFALGYGPLLPILHATQTCDGLALLYDDKLRSLGSVEK